MFSAVAGGAEDPGIESRLLRGHFRINEMASALVSYQSSVDRNGTDFNKWRGCIRGGINKGGCIPPCSWEKGFSSAGDTLLGSGSSGLGEYEGMLPEGTSFGPYPLILK